MKKSTNILIFPAYAENAFELYRALKQAPRFRVFGASSGDNDAGFIFEKHIAGLPFVDAHNFIEEFNKVLSDHAIDIIFTTHDSVLLFLKENEDVILAQVAGGDASCATLCRHKKKLFSFLKKETYCPQVYSNPEEVLDFPVFLKPDTGQGQQGCFTVYDREQLNSLFTDDAIICEYLPGEELSVDCFTNSKGELLFIGPRSRDVAKMGISFVSKSIELTEEIRGIAHSINDKVQPRGLWFFQLKKASNGKFKLLEVSNRCAATMGVYRQLGVNFAQLSAYDLLGFDVEPLNMPLPIQLNRSLKSHYKIPLHYNYVYLDYDDTLVEDDRVNINTIQFVYQSRNEGKKIILLTRHLEDCIYEHLKKMCISDSLFHAIHLVKEGEEKHTYIEHSDAIFIDNLYSERKAVYLSKKIPVFDIDALESLIK